MCFAKNKFMMENWRRLTKAKLFRFLYGNNVQILCQKLASVKIQHKHRYKLTHGSYKRQTKHVNFDQSYDMKCGQNRVPK